MYTLKESCINEQLCIYQCWDRKKEISIYIQNAHDILEVDYDSNSAYSEFNLWFMNVKIVNQLSRFEYHYFHYIEHMHKSR